MNSLKAFISGMAFPAVILPFAYPLFFLEKVGLLSIFPLFIPLIFGLWNLLSIRIVQTQWTHMKLWLTGGVLGLVVGLIAVFLLHTPEMLFGVTGAARFIPILIIPIIYGAIWRYVVGYLNVILGVSEA